MNESNQLKLNVLLIDDDPTISAIIVDMLKRAGHEVTHMLDGRKAVEMAEEKEPDVIILDLMMTKLPGEDVLKQFVHHDTLKSVPILVFSNQGIEQDMSHFEERGAAKVLIKADTSMSKLVKVVEELAVAK